LSTHPTINSPGLRLLFGSFAGLPLQFFLHRFVAGVVFLFRFFPFSYNTRLLVLFPLFFFFPVRCFSFSPLSLFGLMPSSTFPTAPCPGGVPRFYVGGEGGVSVSRRPGAISGRPQDENVFPFVLSPPPEWDISSHPKLCFFLMYAFFPLSLFFWVSITTRFLAYRPPVRFWELGKSPPPAVFPLNFCSEGVVPVFLDRCMSSLSGRFLVPPHRTKPSVWHLRPPLL